MKLSTIVQTTAAIHQPRAAKTKKSAQTKNSVARQIALRAALTRSRSLPRSSREGTPSCMTATIMSFLDPPAGSITDKEPTTDPHLATPHPRNPQQPNNLTTQQPWPPPC